MADCTKMHFDPDEFEKRLEAKGEAAVRNDLLRNAYNAQKRVFAEEFLKRKEREREKEERRQQSKQRDDQHRDTVRLGWIRVVLLSVALVASVIFNVFQLFKEPREVVVQVPHSVEPVKVQFEGESGEMIGELVRALEDQTKVQLESTRDRSKAGSIEQLPGEVPRTFATSIGEDADFNLAPVPTFGMPSGVLGYTPRPLDGIAAASCPTENLLTAGRRVFLLEVVFPDGAELNRFTPIFVRFTRKEPDRLFQFRSQQFETRAGRNRLRVELALTEGDYTLDYGVYAREELLSEYPNYYRQRCDFSVVRREDAGSPKKEHQP